MCVVYVIGYDYIVYFGAPFHPHGAWPCHRVTAKEGKSSVFINIPFDDTEIEMKRPYEPWVRILIKRIIIHKNTIESLVQCR